MKDKINKIIESWIGVDKEVDLGANLHNIGYNQALSDLRSRIPELTDKIVEEEVGEIDGMTIISSDDKQFGLHTDGYNNAIEDIINLIKK
jgi:hypothetical protein